MKIIFLDIDGVLNCRTSCTEFKTFSRLWPPSIKVLNRIIKATGAKIVISSTWRFNHTREQMALILQNEGAWVDVIDMTPRHFERGDGTWSLRGHEIQKWLDGWKGEPIESFVILDDSSDMAHLKERLVQTSMEDGLMDHHGDDAIRMLAQKL